MISIGGHTADEDKSTTGSFDPLTNGHYNIIERAAKLYDELTVGIIVNPSKKSMFTLEERELMIRETLKGLPNVKVGNFSGLLADYVNDNDFNVVVRGLRAAMDFEYEIQMAQMNDRPSNSIKGRDLFFSMTEPGVLVYQLQHDERGAFSRREHRGVVRMKY